MRNFLIWTKIYWYKTAFMDAIILERAVELAFESHRWFDLRRWKWTSQNTN